MPRPKTNIDWEFVDEHLHYQCDGAGIAGLLGIHPDTLYHACERDHNMCFSAYSSIKKGEGKELLRAKQFQTAMEGDKTMLIWLGKQYLEQKERTDLTSGDKSIEPTSIIFERHASNDSGK